MNQYITENYLNYGNLDYYIVEGRLALKGEDSKGNDFSSILNIFKGIINIFNNFSDPFAQAFANLTEGMRINNEENMSNIRYERDKVPITDSDIQLQSLFCIIKKGPH